jgi:hypothetical protein
MENKNIVMKTGFDLVDNGDLDKQQIVAMVTAFTDKAVRSACIFVKHSKRDIVVVEDIKRAMMLEVFMFMKRPGILEETEEIRRQIFYGDSDDEGEDAEASGGEEEDVEEESQGDWVESECTCALCKCINNIYDRWNPWVPTNTWQTILKKHIDGMDVVESDDESDGSDNDNMGGDPSPDGAAVE